jgi:hypothetical protein
MLISTEEVIAAHYTNYPGCTRFKKFRVNYTEILAQLLNNRLADGREVSGIADILRGIGEGKGKGSSSPKPIVIKRLAKKKNLRK